MKNVVVKAPLIRCQPTGNAHTANPQGGFALLTVLLIVALVATMSSQLIYQQHLSIQRSAHMLHQAQSLSVAWGLEGWVKQGLKLDAQNNQIDHLQEQWSQPLVSVPFEGGEISGQLYDLQGRLNLNNVQVANKVQREIWQKIIDRWAVQVGLKAPLSQVLTDWVDHDEERLPDGAESDAYLLMQPPYRAANQALVMVEELKSLQGFQQIDYAPWLLIKATATALPTVTKINVNTASKSVLMALTDTLTEPTVEGWLQLRKDQPANDTVAFRAFIEKQTGQSVAELTLALPDAVISVRSDYFFMAGQVDYGQAKQGVSAIFYRSDTTQVQLVQRWLSYPEAR